MPTQQRLSEVFVELADTLVDDFDVVEFLTTLAHRCAELFDAAEAGVVLGDEAGSLRSVASSTEVARMLDLFELQNEEGPCLDCFRSGRPIVNRSLEEAGAWPAFAPEAIRLGFRAVHAVPMRLRGTVIGAVNLFTTSTRPLSNDDISMAQALADVATISLLQERGIREARVLNEQLQSALHSRVVIEQAKGVLAERRQVDMGRAFELLRRHARRANQKLSDVAIGVVNGTVEPDEVDGPEP
jgi:GAF domain-containing protein